MAVVLKLLSVQFESPWKPALTSVVVEHREGNKNLMSEERRADFFRGCMGFFSGGREGKGALANREVEMSIIAGRESLFVENLRSKLELVVA